MTLHAFRAPSVVVCLSLQQLLHLAVQVGLPFSELWLKMGSLPSGNQVPTITGSILWCSGSV
eukprot:4870018-Amphidinium_carterae.1